MPKYDTQAIRNIALVGHSGSGKTTLLEAMLLKAGVIQTAGNVERGSTVADFDPLEKQHQHSLDSAIASLDHADAHINIIDTPGLPDFRGPALSALDAVETAAVVINAQSGIEMSTRRMMARAKERNRCRLIIINKMDAEDTDLTQLVRDIRTAFGDECLPVNLPAENGSRTTDVFFKAEGEADIFTVDAAHTEITDQVVEMDEDLMEEYLEKGSVDPGKLHDAFEKALRRGHLVPICFTSARTGAGIGGLLDVIGKLMPSPDEGNPPEFLKGEGENAKLVSCKPDPAEHVIAHVFKITNDPFVGKLSVFRIYQGTVTKDSQLLIGDARKPFKVAHLFKLQGKEHAEVDAGIPGDLCAVAKIEDIHYDAVLHDSHDEDNFHLKAVNFPVPMFGLAVEPKTRGSEQKIGQALHKLQEEDSCFLVEQNVELNETVIRGLGDMHLRVMLERLDTRFHVQVDTRPPRIAYRETIRGKAEGHYRHKKQTGGAGQFGEVFLRVEPLPRGEGFEFANAVVGGAIPSGLIPAVEKGVRQVLDEGAVAGYALQDVKVTVYDGKYHPVDSKEVAFATAGKKAFLEAVSKAKPIVLEPMVHIEVTAPDSNMGDISGSLSAKRARISGTESVSGGFIVITALAPMAELSDFQTELKSLTAGQGRYTMDFSHYDPVPGNVQQDLVKAHQPKHDD